MQKRIDWVDQLKGFAIFLVVYGHNFPVTEKYIYSFHMPLFFMVSGFFFPTQLDSKVVEKRAKSILLPYFLWAIILFLIWALIGKKMGNSGEKGYSIFEGFLGIFYAQGGSRYMDWGIPMWFLPAIFLCFGFYYLIRKYIKDIKWIVATVLGITFLSFIYTEFIHINLPWSINVAMVALFFFCIGNLIFRQLDKIPKNWSIAFLIVFVSIHFILYNINDKVDMYRSIYGNPFLFLINGLLGSFFVLFFFKSFPYFKILGVIGKFTMVILALQLLAMSFIKLFLMVVWGQTEFSFSETEKFIYSLVQIALIYPVFLVINKYIPLLNGSPKKI